MPGFDRTGPEGQGSQTGQRLGKCNPNTQKNNKQNAANEISDDNEMRRGPGMGRRFRFGKGKGQGRGLNRGNS